MVIEMVHSAVPGFAWRLIGFATLVLSGCAMTMPSRGDEIPEPLQPWKEWAVWDVEHRDCPTLYSSAAEPMCFWPSRLELSADAQSGQWKMDVRVFEESWVPLSGTKKVWPMNVKSGDQPMVVVLHDGKPSVKLDAGSHVLSGEFRWADMPQRIAIPPQVGMIDLNVDGVDRSDATWDADGNLWLKRTRKETQDKDLLNVQVYRVIEDGIPLWLRTEIELTVSGKSREESLGWILPKGWQLSTVESEIPVAVDERGQMKAQVRAGKWKILVHAFRTTDVDAFQYADEAEPIANFELVGLQTDPSFRVSQIDGLSVVDVTQTTFPTKWRTLPVYRWQTDQTFRLVEKMRGMGDQSHEGLTIDRRFWLDEDGREMTYQDVIKGSMQQIWRLDVSDGHELGAVRVDGEGQLITANPITGNRGVEIRERDLSMEAIGRVQRTSELAATGWQADAETLQVTMTLPPGWRAFAVFGADQVRGDWLTAWSLLDLFLLLIFSLAVLRLFGPSAGVVALVAFGLAYHEPGSPRFTWLFLLMPIALLRVVGDGAAKRWVLVWKYVAIGILLLCLVPFIAMQAQSVIYPQLESTGMSYGTRSMLELPGNVHVAESVVASYDRIDQTGLVKPSQQRGKSRFDTSNLFHDPKSRIQTGPAQPLWHWNDVRCSWNGPVASQQTIQPILISLSQHRILSTIRLGLLMLLAAILMRSSQGKAGEKRPKRWRFSLKPAAAGAVLIATCFVGVDAHAQLPDPQMLQALRTRLLAAPDVYPNAAEIPSVQLSIDENKLQMTAQVHAAIDVAVPLPGRLTDWSPVSVTVDSDEEVLVSRRDGYLWVLVPKGIHEVSVKGLLPSQAEWEWTFDLSPHYVSIDAPGWKVTGVGRDGVPDSQVFFAKERAITDEQAAYDRSDFNAIVSIDRYIEMGLTAKVRTHVTRLSSPGKAISVNIPLLPDESVLSSGREVENGSIAVRLGATQTTSVWDSELPLGKNVELSAAQTDQWVERWHLITSPVWNVAINGLPPIFESQQKDLIPVWHPWPGETVELNFSRPVAVTGDVMTVQNVNHQTSVGSRRRTNKLLLDLECSLASDFVVQLDPEADVFLLTMNDEPIPVQRYDADLIIPTRTGKQRIALEWRTSEEIDPVVRASRVVLPVEASNVTSEMSFPDNRWILWTDGPLRGPAVRFWSILIVAILAALALGSIPASPIGRFEWVLLVIGLTQIHLVAAAVVVGWLFLLSWRGKNQSELRPWAFNSLQLFIVLVTFAALAILVVVVGEGLLGNPEMFIVGNGSRGTDLRWFQPRSGTELPSTFVLSISVWFYRMLMLFWALWLATALLRWLTWGWQQFSSSGTWRHSPKPILATEVKD
tara:strand:- start:15367 stop:19425 length:4059 start_codon:yes stop_codon:yes gene_type:complete